jgi:hypothetical protein
MSFEGFLLFLILKKRNGRDRDHSCKLLSYKHLYFRIPISHRGGHGLTIRDFETI